MSDLGIVIDRWLTDAAALRRNGEPAKAALLERCAEETRDAAHEWLTWLSEAEAALRSGRSVEWLRGRYRDWQPQGHARQVGRATRIYRAAVVPRRAALERAAAEGVALARASMRRAS
jgi:hypothetical protein